MALGGAKPEETLSESLLLLAPSSCMVPEPCGEAVICLWGWEERIMPERQNSLLLQMQEPPVRVTKQANRADLLSIEQDNRE